MAAPREEIERLISEFEQGLGQSVSPVQSGAPLSPAYPRDTSGQGNPQVQYIVTGLPNNGAIAIGPDGKYYYKDDSVAGGEELALPVMKQLEQGVPKSEIRTPRQVIESEMRQEVIQQAGGPMAGLLGPKKLEGYAGVGSYLDEAAGVVAQAAGADPAKVRQDAQALSRSLQGEYPVLSELAKMYGLAESIYIGTKLMPILKAGGAAMMPKAAQTVQKVGQAIEAAPPLAGQIANVAKATGLAATEGMIYGAGEGEGVEDRIVKGLERARDAAIISAPLAAIFPYLGRAIQSRADSNATVNELAERLGVSVEASRLIYENLKAGATLEDAVNNMVRAGESRMVADANEAAATLLDAAAASSPSARQQADRAVTGRVEQQSQKVLGGLEESVGPQVPRGTTTEQAVMAETKQARQEAYDRAYAPKVDVTTPQGEAVVKMLETLDADDLSEQLKRANKLLRNKEDKVDYDIIDGRVIFYSEPSVKFLDSLKRSLQSKAQGLKYDDPEMYLLYSELARDVKAVAEGVSPAYGEAVQLGGDVIATREAGKLGETALGSVKNLDEIITAVQGASTTDLMAMRMGLRRNIENIIGDVKTAAGKATSEEAAEMQRLLRELSSSANRQKIELILGREKSASFFNQLDEAKAAFELQSRVAVGSGTAQRAAFQESLKGQVEGGFMTKLLSADPKAIGDFRDILTGASQEWRDEKREAILRDVINVLAERTGKDADLALKYIREAARGTLSPVKATYVSAVVSKAIKELQGATLPAGIGIAGERLMGMGEQ